MLITEFPHSTLKWWSPRDQAAARDFHCILIPLQVCILASKVGALFGLPVVLIHRETGTVTALARAQRDLLEPDPKRIAFELRSFLQQITLFSSIYFCRPLLWQDGLFTDLSDQPVVARFRLNWIVICISKAPSALYGRDKTRRLFRLHNSSF